MSDNNVLEIRKLTPTTLEQLSEYGRGALVELPPFSEGQRFVARLGRPSLVSMMRDGSIPNTLMGAAMRLFTGEKEDDVPVEEQTATMLQVLDIMCHASLLEPTYEQLEAAGVKLTDQQVMFLFKYSQTGVQALTDFRKE